jgi:hypothetical protein
MTRILDFITICCAVLLIGSTALGATQLGADARRHFEAGIAYVDDPNGSNWEDALKEFRAAYELSHAWQILNNIGLCALNLERDGEAIAAYREYLAHSKEKEFSTRQRKQIESDVAMLSASLVEVTVEVEPQDAIVTDERRNARGNLVVNQYVVKNGKAKIGVHPGLHKMIVQAQGYLDAEWSFNADPSSSHQHRFELETSKKAEPVPTAPPLPTASEPLVVETPRAKKRRTSTAVYVGLAATSAFAVAATVTGIIALNKDSAYNHAASRADGDHIKSSGKLFALATDIGIGAALLSAGITAYLYFAAPERAESQAALVSTRGSGRSASNSLSRDGPKAATSQVGLAPIVSPHTAGFGLSAQF